MGHPGYPLRRSTTYIQTRSGSGRHRLLGRPARSRGRNVDGDGVRGSIADDAGGGRRRGRTDRRPGRRHRAGLHGPAAGDRRSSRPACRSRPSTRTSCASRSSASAARRSTTSPMSGWEPPSTPAFGSSASDDGRLGDADAVFVCVPRRSRPPRIRTSRPILSAATYIGRHIQRGQLIILQSTTFPGTTTGPFREAIEGSGLQAGTDFDLAYAPERVNPGDPASASKGVPRLVGATTADGTHRAAKLLARINDEVVEMSSPDAAEMAKLLENVFRNINIAFVNQLALLCERMDLDVWEVIGAAATKPFGFMKFTPGPGVGGHCIPVDPYYLSWRAREFDFIDRFIEAAGDINLAMPRHVVDLVAEALNDRGRALMGSKVGVLGRRLQAEHPGRPELARGRDHRRDRRTRRGHQVPRPARRHLPGRVRRKPSRARRARRAARLGGRDRRRDRASPDRLGRRLRTRGPHRGHGRQLEGPRDASTAGPAPGCRLVLPRVASAAFSRGRLTSPALSRGRREPVAARPHPAARRRAPSWLPPWQPAAG